MKRIRLGITSKLTLLFVLFAALLLAGVGLLAYTSGRSALISATTSELRATALEKEAALNAWIEDRRLNIGVLANAPDLREHVATFMATPNPANKNRLVKALQPWAGKQQQYLNLLIIDVQNGRVIAATNPTEEGKFRENRPFFINGRNGPYVQNVYYSLTRQQPSMTAAAPLYAPDGKLIAVLAGWLNLDEMNAIINRRTELHRTDEAFLVNEANLFVTQPRFITDPAVLRQGNYSESVKSCLNGNSGVVSTENYRGISAITVYRWMAERELCLIVKLDQAEALAPAQAFGRTLLLAGGLILLAALLLATGLARTITRPVLALQRGAARFGQGDLNVRLPVTSTDELSQLAREFNAMATSLSEKEVQLRRYTEELEELVRERTAEIAQSLEREQRARAELELIREHLAFLAEASKVLASSLDYQTTLAAVAQLAVPDIADWCAVDILTEDEALQRVAVAHVDPDKVEFAYELQRRYPFDPDAPQGVAQVLRTGQSEFYPEIREVVLEAAGIDQERLRIIRQLGLRSAIVVPLRTYERVLGAITLVWAESGHRYSQADLELAEELGRRAAVAVENARLYREARQLNIELEKRVKERTASLEASNRELEAFTYSVSHDLRSPLRAIDGFSRVLLEQYNADLAAEAQRYLGLVRQGAQQMGQLIDDLLAFSRLNRQPLRKQQIEPADLVARVLEELQVEQEGRQIEITLGELPPCWADAALLKQVWFNLLSNALKYTRRQEVAKIEVGSCLEDGETAYFVKDNGVGFDMQYANKLFGVFQRLHLAEEYEGTGVGLAIVQRIIHRHGGRIWAEAELNKGATFYFTLTESRERA